MPNNVSVEGWAYMKAGDAISGKEGALYATVDVLKAGTSEYEKKVVQVAECKNITATITKNKSEFKALGYRGTQHKTTGWNGTGTLVVHYASSNWIKQMLRYVRDGIDEYFTLQIVNQDPTSSIGKQVVNLYDVNIDECELAKLDIDADYLEQSINFTFSGAELMEGFSNLSSGDKENY